MEVLIKEIAKVLATLPPYSVSVIEFSPPSPYGHNNTTHKLSSNIAKSRITVAFSDKRQLNWKFAKTRGK